MLLPPFRASRKLINVIVHDNAFAAMISRKKNIQIESIAIYFIFQF